MITIQRNEKNRNKTWIIRVVTFVSGISEPCCCTGLCPDCRDGTAVQQPLAGSGEAIVVRMPAGQGAMGVKVGKKNNFLWVRNNRNHQKAIESYDFCQLQPHLFSRRKELRGYPLIRRVGAISLCKFMTAPLALRTRGSVMGGICYPGVD